MEIFGFNSGTAPVLMSIPHVGTVLPDDLAGRMTPEALAVADTDRHLDRLYDFARDLGVSVLQAIHSRYVIDLNRPPDGATLYPGADNTELLPTTTFAEQPIYRVGQEPDEAEAAHRVEAFWRPYHRRIEDELASIRRRHGVAVLFDCHSIRSRVPRFFDGRLPDLNLGTAAGESCSPDLRDKLTAALKSDAAHTHAVDGRFKGGYITRHYGDPAQGVHAFQMELSQATYMNEDPPFDFREDLAAGIRPTLKAMLAAAVDWADTSQ
jgi:N-formylglutamate deformylase